MIGSGPVLTSLRRSRIFNTVIILYILFVVSYIHDNIIYTLHILYTACTHLILPNTSQAYIFRQDSAVDSGQGRPAESVRQVFSNKKESKNKKQITEEKNKSVANAERIVGVWRWWQRGGQRLMNLMTSSKQFHSLFFLLAFSV